MQAIVRSVELFSKYLYPRPFKIRTDHRPLTWMLTTERLASRFARWLVTLSGYESTIEYQSGKVNLSAVVESRGHENQWKKHIFHKKQAPAVPIVTKLAVLPRCQAILRGITLSMGGKPQRTKRRDVSKSPKRVDLSAPGVISPRPLTSPQVSKGEVSPVKSTLRSRCREGLILRQVVSYLTFLAGFYAANLVD